MDKSDLIKPKHLRVEIINYKSTGGKKENNFEMRTDLSLELAKLELKLIEIALRKVEGKKGLAWKLLGLNDRHALRRRVEATIFSYPNILEDYPYIKRKYAAKVDLLDSNSNE